MVGALYFFLSLILLFLAVGVVRPRWLGQTIGLVASVPLLLVALFVPQLIGFGLLTLLAFARFGAFNSTMGLVGLGIHLIAWGLLVRYLWNLRGVLPVVDGQPIVDAEHPFPDHAGPGLGLLEGRAPSLWPTLALRTQSMSKVEVIRDVVYREVDGIRLRLDVYRPKNRSAQLLPSIIFVHGGAWVLGSKRQSPFLMFDLAAAGYVVFAINYRLAPRFPLPAAIHDCKAAVAWVSEHAPKYGGTPDAVAMGNSAGGHLAAMLACSAVDRSLQPGFEDKDCSVRGGVILYGLSDFTGIFEHHPHPIAHYLLEELVFCRRYREHTEVFRRAQPVSYLSTEIPPLLLIHGEHDVMIPIVEAHNFYQRLKEAGARRVHLCEVPLAPHAFEIAPTPLQQRTQRVIESFLSTL